MAESSHSSSDLSMHCSLYICSVREYSSLYRIAFLIRLFSGLRMKVLELEFEMLKKAHTVSHVPICSFISVFFLQKLKCSSVTNLISLKLANGRVKLIDRLDTQLATLYD